MTGHFEQREAATEIPDHALGGRSHGSLDAIIDSERRGLRPIGSTAREIAARTNALLADLLSNPAVWIFAGIRSAAPDLPCVSHAVAAGRGIALIESVAWPPGRYAATAAGHVHCDGVYIGQSAGPLMAAVRHWRGLLPHDHRVGAIVIVYPAAKGEISLPEPVASGLIWTSADDAISAIRGYLPSGQVPFSAAAVTALLAATARPEGEPHPEGEPGTPPPDSGRAGRELR